MWTVSVTMWCDVSARNADMKGQIASCPNLAILHASMCQHLVCCSDYVPFPGGHYRAGDLPAPMLGKCCTDTSFNLLMRSIEWRDVFSARTRGTWAKATGAR